LSHAEYEWQAFAVVRSTKPVPEFDAFHNLWQSINGHRYGLVPISRTTIARFQLTESACHSGDNESFAFDAGVRSDATGVPGVTTALALEEMVSGYEKAFSHRARLYNDFLLICIEARSLSVVKRLSGLHEIGRCPCCP
jgi:hypothetical protein